MLGWTELRAHLQSQRELLRDDPRYCALRWSLDGRFVDQRVDVREVFGRAWLNIVTDIGPAGGALFARTLERNMRLPLGMIGMESDRYRLVFGAPLAHQTLEEVERWMELLALEALRLRREEGASRRSSGTVFSCFAD